MSDFNNINISLTEEEIAAVNLFSQLPTEKQEMIISLIEDLLLKQE